MKHKTKIGKYYQIGDDHVKKAEKVLVIETNAEVLEKSLATLPKKLKEKFKIKST